ncbi:unnamed protein product [Rhizopus stolonifer]
MEPKATLIETPFHALKSKFNKDTINHIDNTFIKSDHWPSNTIYSINKNPNYAKKKDRARSVPSSSSSPSLPLIKRSMTGSSISSTNSSLSTGSLRRHHHPWAQWFTPPPPLPVPTKPLASSPECRQRRARVVKELIETEKSYQIDMALVQEIYYEQAPFSLLEKKQIFINLPDLLIFEKEFLHALENLLEDEDDIGSLCKIFSNLINRMEQLYAEYCKRHEDSISKLQELNQANINVQDYLKKCQQDIQGRTMSWDLPSLLIKPVQRILKYPLLFKEILQLTPEYDVDYEALVLTHHEIELLADHINEIKKRKDIVEQLLINEHKKKVNQSINKRWTRKVHMKRQNASIDTKDIAFNNIYRQFEDRQEKAKQFEKEALEWIKTMKDSNENLKGFLMSFEEKNVEQTLLQMSEDISSTETMIQVSVCDRIESFLKLFKNPELIIQKRNRKWIDYDRACHIASKGEVPDKQLQIAAEAYSSLNAHLLDELPAFLSLSSTYFDIILDEFVGIQAFFWRRREQAWKPLLREQEQEESVMSWVDFLHTEPKEKEPMIPETISSEGIFDQPVFECVALTDYETKENLKVKEGDVIQVWLITSDKDPEEQWWYGCLFKDQLSGWFPSSVCKKII